MRLVPAIDVCRFFGTTAHIAAEVFLEFLVLHAAQPLCRVAHDFIAARGEDVGGKPIVAYCQQTVVRLQMQVVSSTKCLLALGIDIGPEVVLVGRLVGREPRVAVKTVGTVLYLYVGYLWIECYDALYSLLYALLLIIQLADSLLA